MCTCRTHCCAFDLIQSSGPLSCRWTGRERPEPVLPGDFQLARSGPGQQRVTDKDRCAWGRAGGGGGGGGVVVVAEERVSTGEDLMEQTSAGGSLSPGEKGPRVKTSAWPDCSGLNR